MPKTKRQINIEKELIKEVKSLSKEVKSLSKEVKKLKGMEFIKIFKHPFKFMWFSFLKGLMVGFGSVLGATVLVALFIFVLSQISFVPIVGEFIQEVMSQIEISPASE